MFTGHESPLTINNELKQHHRSPGLCHKGSRKVHVNHFRNHTRDGAAPVLPCASASAHDWQRTQDRDSTWQPTAAHPPCSRPGLGAATKPFLNQAASTRLCSLAQVPAGVQQRGWCRDNPLSVQLWATFGPQHSELCCLSKHCLAAGCAAMIWTTTGC